MPNTLTSEAFASEEALQKALEHSAWEQYMREQEALQDLADEAQRLGMYD